MEDTKGYFLQQKEDLEVVINWEDEFENWAEVVYVDDYFEKDWMEKECFSGCFN